MASMPVCWRSLIGLIALLLVRSAGAQVAPPVQFATPLSPRNASYTIEVDFEPGSQMLNGRQIITWKNLQEVPADELWFHLYWNGWRNNRSTWMLEDRFRKRSDRRDTIEEKDWSFLRVLSIRQLGSPENEELELTTAARFEAPDDGNADDRTVMVLSLPAPVEPKASIQLELVWQAKIPRTFARTGFRGDYFFIAHWFPKLGVFEADGWNCHQYHAGTEYFSDYGVYDVTITLPGEYVVGSTGEEIERRENPEGTTSYRFYQEDVHDFVWTASPDYLVENARFEVPGLPPVDLTLLYQPEHKKQVERHLDATRAALRSYGTWYGPYPYGHLTIVDPAYGSGAGGMEYPTLFTAGTRLFNPFGAGSPEGVTIHETGHQFWYALVGNNEFEDAWIDEGLNTFSTARTYHEAYGDRKFSKRYFTPPGTRTPGRDPRTRGFLPLILDGVTYGRSPYMRRMDRYRKVATTDIPATPTYLYFPASGSRITYNKTALWLATLERHLGWETLQLILSEFFKRSKFGHPRPEDFFGVADEVSGQDLSWFFDEVFRSSESFDYAITSVASVPAAIEGLVEDSGEFTYFKPADTSTGGSASTEVFRTEVVVSRLGGGVFPVEVLLVFEDGEEIRHQWDGRYRWEIIVEERPSRLRYATVDPEHILQLDINRTNNSRLLKSKATLPAVKWASKWMVWLQDFLATVGFFV